MQTKKTPNKNQMEKKPQNPKQSGFSRILDFLYNGGMIKSSVTQRKAVRELLLM